MWRVEFKHHAGGSSWTRAGSYGSETTALNVAVRLSERHFATRVLDPNGAVVWSG